jgi:hypothetical protein
MEGQPNLRPLLLLLNANACFGANQEESGEAMVLCGHLAK